MKLKDVILRAVSLTDETDLEEYLKTESAINPSVTVSERLNKYVDYANFILCEIASSFIPMQKTESVNPTTCLFFSTLSENITNIISVKNNGRKVCYQTEINKLTAKSGIDEITYLYVPSQYSLSDEIGDFIVNVSEGLIALGILAERCICIGKFDEGVCYRERFVEGLSKLKRLKSGKCKERDFI